MRVEKRLRGRKKERKREEKNKNTAREIRKDEKV